jgi:hypothetical protein
LYFVFCFVQHGNVAANNGFMASFNWTVPGIDISERCAIRLRYNISTGDTVNWADDQSVQAGVNGDHLANPLTRNPTANTNPATQPVWLDYGLNYTEIASSFKVNNVPDANILKTSREYVMKNNPRVDMFGPLLPPSALSRLKVQLAINTAQYGRTFQDRSHRFVSSGSSSLRQGEA